MVHEWRAPVPFSIHGLVFLRLKPVESVDNKMSNEKQADVMSGLHNTAQNPARAARPVKLSPEINEFLHMLNALEGQLESPDTKAAAKR